MDVSDDTSSEGGYVAGRSDLSKEVRFRRAHRAFRKGCIYFEKKKKPYKADIHFHYAELYISPLVFRECTREQQSLIASIHHYSVKAKLTNFNRKDDDEWRVNAQTHTVRKFADCVNRALVSNVDLTEGMSFCRMFVNDKY